LPSFHVIRTAVLTVAFATAWLVAGAAHSDGPVVGWGANGYALLTPPPSVNGTSGTATAIAAGLHHSCAIQTGTGNVVCWGYDTDGEATPPAAVDGTTGTATAIAAGGSQMRPVAFGHTCAIQAITGNVVCWGDNGYGGQATPPPSVNGTTGTATVIAAGGIHSCAIQAGSGAVVCWGRNLFGQATPPPSVNGTTGTATAIAAGDNHSCAIQAGSGAVVCWGYDAYGESTPPASVNGTDGTATAIAAGGSHTLAIAAPEPTAALLSAASLGSLLLLARRSRPR